LKLRGLHKMEGHLEALGFQGDDTPVIIYYESQFHTSLGDRTLGGLPQDETFDVMFSRGRLKPADSQHGLTHGQLVELVEQQLGTGEFVEVGVYYK
jgi:hypothetical protein